MVIAGTVKIKFNFYFVMEQRFPHIDATNPTTLYKKKNRSLIVHTFISTHGYCIGSLLFDFVQLHTKDFFKNPHTQVKVKL